MKTNDKLNRLTYYMPKLNDIMNIIEAYAIDMDTICKIVRMASIMDTERGPGYTERLLKDDYIKYHQWSREH